MNATISVVSWKYKPLSNGECPLFFQISQKGRRKYQSMGISVDPSFWDFKEKRLKPDCPNGEYLQKIILDKITSQLPVERWYDIIGEKTVADAIMDRIV